MKKEIKSVEVLDFLFHEEDDILGTMDFVTTEIRGYDENGILNTIVVLTEEGIVWYWTDEYVRVLDSNTGDHFMYSDVFGLRFNTKLSEHDKSYYRQRFLKGMKIDHCIGVQTDLDDYELRKINHWLRGRF